MVVQRVDEQLADVRGKLNLRQKTITLGVEAEIARGQQQFGLTDVGPAPQQLRRQSRGHCWEGDGVEVAAARDRTGQRAGQQTDSILLLADRLFQFGNQLCGGLVFGLRLGQLQLRGVAEARPVAGDAQGLLAGFGGLAGHLQLVVQR